MSLPPITIPLLDPAGTIDPENDLLVIRQGLNDRKVPARDLLSIRLSTFSMLPSQLVASDVLLVGRNNGGGYDNYIMPPQYLGFLNGTQMWFFQGSAPLGWSIVPDSGDKILGTRLPGGGTNTYNTVGYHGTWQQRDVSGVENQGLSTEQIPNHRHFATFGENQSNSQAQYIHGAKTGANFFGVKARQNPIRGMVGAFQDNANHDNYGACSPHNHGNNWRPAAAVGILCVKNKLVGE